MPKKSQPAPSSGERNAKMGYHAQDLYCARILVDALRGNQLKAIRITDPKAGRVDDFQLLQEGRVDAWQVKWHTFSGYFTLNDLIVGGDNPSLAAQLADGRKKIKTERPAYRVVVHLATNNLPSENDTKIPGKGGVGMHMAAFMDECWRPVRLGKIKFENVEPKWKPWLNAIRKASGLTAAQFPDFIADCELEFGCRPPEIRDLDRDTDAKQKELKRVTEYLYDESGSPENRVELSREDLIQRLGLRESFALRSRHEFPVDDQTYEPIESSVQKLESLLDQKKSGYVCLLGTPGAGKSTLLTKTLQNRSERIVRYYAFVPDAQDPTILRGETENFLHDLVVTLRRQGLSGGIGTLDSFDRGSLLLEFTMQLQLVQKEWKESGKKTIILIDGLDHIEREQHPERSLLQDLLPPDAVPEGVLFILGTQTDAVLPSRIRQYLDSEPERRFVIDPLTRAEVGEIIRRSNLDHLIATQYDRVLELSSGHPLALNYLLNKVANAKADEEVKNGLRTESRYTGDIEATYNEYWQAIVANHRQIIPLLALICRIRRVIDLDWVALWAPVAEIRDLNRTSSHLFRKETATRWYIFHNSFRLFLIQKTALDALDRFSEAEDKRLHAVLADHCREQHSPAVWKWEELYHRAKAQEHERVLELTGQDWVRSQFLACRAQPSIQTDLNLAAKSLAKSNDGVAAIRIGLIATEISRRHHTLESESMNLISMLIKTDQVEKALSWMRDGNRLLVADSTALQFCRPLSEKGFHVEARALFDLVDPLSFFDDPHGLAVIDEQTQSLATWFLAASLFESLDECLKTIEKYRFKVEKGQRRDLVAASSAQNEKLHALLRMDLAYGFVYRRHWDDFAAICKTVPKGTGEYRGLILQACRTHLDDGEADLARELLQANEAESLGQGPAEKITLAEISARLPDLTKCQQLLATIQLPALNRGGMGVANGFECFGDRFRYYRLAYLCGEWRTPVALVPVGSEEDEHTIHFLRCLAIVAKLSASGWREGGANFYDVRNDLSNVLRFYDQGELDMHDWKDGMQIRYSRGSLHSLIIGACAANGKLMVEGLCRLLDEIWGSFAQRYWPTEVQIEMVTELIEAGADKDWGKRWLERLWSLVNGELNSETFVYKTSLLAKASMAVGDVDQARAYFDKMVERSFGVGDRKDYQLTIWVQLFGKLAETLPDRGLSQIDWLARRIARLEDEVASKACKEALGELLGVCLSSNPDRADRLLCWLEANDCIWYEEALRSMLGYLVEQTNCPFGQVLEFVRSILVPISISADPGLVRQAIVGFSKNNPNEVRQRVDELVLAISTEAPSSTREKWLNGVARGVVECGVDFSSFGLDPSLLNWSDQHASRERLSLQDGTSRAFAELETELTTTDRVIEMVQKEAPSSYFAWGSLIQKIADRFDASGIQKIVSAFTNKKDYCEVVEAFSRRLVSVGESAVLWQLSLKGIEVSKGKTWQRMMDGAPRCC